MVQIVATAGAETLGQPTEGGAVAALDRDAERERERERGRVRKGRGGLNVDWWPKP